MEETKTVQTQVTVRPPTNHPLAPSQETALVNCPTNLDLTTKHGKAMAIAASSPGDIEFSKDGVLRIRATHFIIFPENRIDEESGELSQFCRTVFFDKLGNTFRTSAAHGPANVKALLDLYSPEEWAEGIPLVIRARMGKRDRMYHDIRIDES